MQPKLLLRWESNTPESAVFIGVENDQPVFSLEIKQDNLAALIETCYRIVLGDRNTTPHASYEKDLLGWVGEYIPVGGVPAVLKAASIVLFAMQHAEEFADTAYDFEILPDGQVTMEDTMS